MNWIERERKRERERGRERERERRERVRESYQEIILYPKLFERVFLGPTYCEINMMFFFILHFSKRREEEKYV